MRISDYLSGIPMAFYSPLPEETVAKRINAASNSVLNPFALNVTGYARFGRVMLEHRTFPYYNAKPRFNARLSPGPRGTKIDGKFGAATWHKLFFVFWYVFLIVLSLFWISAYVNGTGDSEFFDRFGFLPLVFFVAPLAFHFMFSRGWRSDMQRIAEFLESEVEAQRE